MPAPVVAATLSKRSLVVSVAYSVLLLRSNAKGRYRLHLLKTTERALFALLLKRVLLLLPTL